MLQSKEWLFELANKLRQAVKGWVMQLINMLGQGRSKQINENKILTGMLSMMLGGSWAYLSWTLLRQYTNNITKSLMSQL